MAEQLVNDLLSFIKSSPTTYHAVKNITDILEQNGFLELSENSRWDIKTGSKCYVVRNNSSVIAFKVGNDLDNYGFNIAASHSDSPTFKIKENAEIYVKDKYTKLDTEGYGGMILSSWLDRPLSIAGRVVVKEKDNLVTHLLKFDRDLVMIPNLAIHMNRKVNDGYTFNKQIDMLPVISGKTYEDGCLKQLVADELGVDENAIYGMDLFLYNRVSPSIWGIDEEFISASQLDDLESAYASLCGFIEGGNDKNIQVYACFDNEEVGSGTKQGAKSTFLSDTLSRINRNLGKSEDDYLMALANSFMVSCDNAHAVHPNHPDKTDVNNCTYMNDGIVIKAHAGQKYTSDAVSVAIFKNICEKANVPVQFFANRSDMEGGSTLGNLAMSQVSVKAIDIGLAQLAMHSAYETAGAMDIEYMVRAMKEFFNSYIEEVSKDVIKVL